MKKVFIVANWKSNITGFELKSWIDGLKIQDLKFFDKEIIICPPFTLLSDLKECLLREESTIKIGAQDISPLDEGAYTGEVNGKQLREFAEYTIIGHSERRKNFSESKEIVNLKIKQAFKHGLSPIVCVSDLDQSKALQEVTRINTKLIVSYEPLFAVGSGTADTPENADQMAKKIKDILGEVPILYGGSVNHSNVDKFTKMLHIDGVLVGKASLDPAEFLQISKNA
jgi:triosephosphate isomerase (TIM)